MKRPILVVEDEELNIALFRAVLARAPQWLRQSELHTARSLNEARARLIETRPDLIVLDLRLPDGDGLELARELSGTQRDSRPHILAVTANALDTDRARALEAGCDAFLTKPYQPAALIDAIGSVTGWPRATLKS